jgi:hypothetical protein
MARCFPLLGFSVFALASDTIARKPQHDKTTCRAGDRPQALHRAAGIAIV